MYQETKEQKLIVLSDSSFIAIKAFAGTGKTTTLIKFSEARPEKRILYIAYNKETARKGSLLFPSNVTCKTAHSIAYGRYGYPLSKKLSRKTSLPFKAETIRKLFGFKKTYHSLKLSQFLKTTLEDFCFSTYLKIEDSVPLNNLPDSRESIIMFLKELWSEMLDPKSNFPTTPDVYLKKYCLSNPILDYDYILFDEAQDANPLILELILSQAKTSKLVFVGDEYQSIYSFRGAKNSLQKIKAEQEFFLTKSFRFGNNIANIANIILKTLSTNKQSVKAIKGFELINDIVGEVNKKEPFAVISRTNSNLFLSALSAYEKNYKIHFVGGFDSYNFKKILDIEKLYFKEYSKIKDNYIRTFKTFEDYKSSAIYQNDKEMLYYIKVVDKYNGKLSELIKGVKESSVSLGDADIILSTVHKSKGLEFNQVILSNDFPNLIKKDKQLNYRKLEQDEVNILYVAATRAISVLKINKQIEDIVNYYNENKIAEKIGNSNIIDNDTINERESNNTGKTDSKNVYISNFKNKF